MFSEKMDLRLPGPVQVPGEIQRAMLRSFDHPMMDYRNEEFREILKEASTHVKMIFQTRNNVYTLCGSGASALETAMVNIVGPSDTIIICVIGYFGEYLIDVAEHIGLNVIRVDAPWGEVVDPALVKEALDKHPEIKAVFVTHCETSTGAINDIQTIGSIVKNYNALFVVDAVSSIVGAPLYMDEWSIDIVATGGQKALMLPPGIALVAASDKAWDMIDQHTCPSFYLNLKKYKQLLPEGHTPYTPNIALVNGLIESCRMIAAEGMENSYKRHACLRDMTRAGVRALGLSLLVDDSAASPTLTSVVFDKVDADLFRKMMRENFHVALGGGLGQFKGKLLRLGHMGYTDEADILKMFAALELGLVRVGYDIKLGASVAAAQQFWMENPYTEFINPFNKVKV